MNGKNKVIPNLVFANTNQTRSYEISGEEYQLDIVEQLLWTISHLSSIGASRDIKVSVDGDGAANISVVRKDGELAELDNLEQQGDLDNLSFGIGD